MKTKDWVLNKKIKAGCSETHTKYINALCGQKVESVNVTHCVKIATELLKLICVGHLRSTESVIKQTRNRIIVLGLPLPPTYCRCKGLEFDLSTHTDTPGRNPLDKGSARRTDLYLHNTQQSQQTDIHDPGGVRTRNLSKRAAAELRLRPRGPPQ
jgi:hypothetical protein